MTSKLTIAKVGGGVIDLTGFAPALMKGAPYFEANDSLIELGMRFDNGQAQQGSFKVLDPEAEIARVDFTYNLPAHKIITWTEDAPGSEIWLFRGRTSSYDGGRGHALTDNFVEFDVTADDINRDLRYQAFTEPWVRPTETDVARLVALDAYTLSGAASTATNHGDDFDITISTSHLAPNSNTVSMPAKTYPVGTQPQDVVTDCADTAGKVYGVVPHHVGGSHACLLYIVETDHSTYASPIKISDNLADWDPEDLATPVFEPHWEAGKATLYDGQELLSGLVSIYNSESSVFVEYASNVTDYGYAVEAYFDADSVTPAQAIVKANGILSSRRLTHVTHRVSIIMLSEQVDLVTVGMSLEIKAAAAIAGQYLDIYQTRRVAQCTFEPRLDGRYWAHLELDRATTRRGASPGRAVVRPPPVCLPDTPGTLIRAWDFGQGNNLDTLQELSSGLQYSAPGAAYNTASKRASGHMPVTAGTTYTFSWTGYWFEQPSGRDIEIRFDNGGAGVGTVRVVEGAGHAGNTVYSVGASVVAPPGALRAAIWHSPFMGIMTSFQSFATAGTPADNDPNCVPDPGSSPYYARSDDPRFNPAPAPGSSPSVVAPAVPLRNTSGGDLTKGSVVVSDPTDEMAFTTTTSAAQTARSVGVLTEDIDDDAIGLVAFNGVVEEIRVSGAPAIGDLLSTASIAGEAQASATRTAGVFGEVLSAEVTESPTLVAFGTQAQHINAALTPGLPTGWAEDDIFLLFHVYNSGGSVTPSGWNTTPTSPQNPGGGGSPNLLEVFWRRATASESAPTVAAAGNAMAVIAAFRGCPTSGNPWNAIAGGTEGSDTSVEVPGATTTIADCYVLVITGREIDNASPQFSAWTNANLVGLTEIYDAGYADGLGGGLGIAAGIAQAVGNYGSTTATAAASTRDAMMSIALQAVPTSDATVVALLWGQTDPDASGPTATHIADTADAHDASAISILDAAADFTATDVEGALAELQSDAEAHLADATDAHDASAISVLDTGGNFAGTDVEAVLAELDASIAAGGIPATIFDAAGDLIVASAADTAVRFPLGTALHHLRVNAAGTGLEYAAESGGGLGAWTDYTPSWTAITTNPTLGSTTITGRYKELDSKTLAVSIAIVVTTGGAWNAGSGAYSFSLPAGKTSAARIQIISGHVLDSGTTHFVAAGKVGISATTIGEIVVADAANPKLLASAAPVTWATGDQINLSGIIEIV